MLRLLTVNQAASYILHWNNKIPDPTDPATMIMVIEDEDLSSIFRRYQMFISNAIDSGVLPAIRKPKPKPEEKRLMGNVDIPEDIKCKIDKLYDVWITWEDLFVFVERSASVSTHSYSHSRQSMATIAWILLDKVGYDDTNPTKLAEELGDIVEDYEIKNIKLQLGDTTLKNCIKEIFDAKKDILKEKI